MISLQPEQYSEYMIFCTDTYIGIHHMPPDGNPFKYAAMIGHPTELLDFVMSCDRSHIVTIGRDDHCCLFWRIKIE